MMELRTVQLPLRTPLILLIWGIVIKDMRFMKSPLLHTRYSQTALNKLCN